MVFSSLVTAGALSLATIRPNNSTTSPGLSTLQLAIVLAFVPTPTTAPNTFSMGNSDLRRARNMSVTSLATVEVVRYYSNLPSSVVSSPKHSTKSGSFSGPVPKSFINFFTICPLLINFGRTSMLAFPVITSML